MKQRYLYKAKTKKDNEWIEGYYFFNAMFNIHEIQKVIKFGYVSELVDEKTISACAYKDERFVIWEGDWWKEEDCKCVIQYDDDACCWKVGYYYINEKDFDVCYEDEELSNFNIGNIWTSIQGNIHD